MEREVRGSPDKSGFTPSQKREIRIMQDNTCLMCGESEKPNKAKFEVHHGIPLSKGGKSVIENGKLLCKNDHIVANWMFIHYGIVFEDLIGFINQYRQLKK